MSEQQTDRASFPDFPSKYWSTLTHHDHQQPPNPLSIETQLEHLGQIRIDPDRHDTAYFNDFTYRKTMISPSTRTCSSLLSEMLRPVADSHPSSPATTHAERLSEHGSFSTHSTPPLQATPPKRAHISFGAPQTVKTVLTPPEKAPLTIETSELRPTPPRPARHISFGVITSHPSRPVPMRNASEQAPASSDDNKDGSAELTPVPKRSIQFAAAMNVREPPRRTVSDYSDHPSDEGSTTSSRPRLIRFAGPSGQVPSAENSRRSSCSEVSGAPQSGDEGTKSRVVPTRGGNASPPVLASRAGPATCKSTLDAMLKKESIAKVIDTVPEEEEDDDDEGEDGVGQDENDNDDDNDDDDDDIQSILELGSDDDGYQEDIESDDDVFDDDIYPPVLVESGTPRIGFVGRIDITLASKDVMPQTVQTPIFRTAAPLESDLPDTTDFAPGTIDEDQPACIAFDMAIRDREARRRPAKPSDIDPTFPDSGSEEYSDVEPTTVSPTATTGGRATCRSPPVAQRSTCKQRWNSPPLAKASEFRAMSLPRRYLTGRKGLYAPKPQRAVTIKQSNEQRAQRRREKKEVRQNLRRGKQEVDHNGHEKMKVHCLSRKKLIATENPCVIRPVMSI